MLTIAIGHANKFVLSQSHFNVRQTHCFLCEDALSFKWQIVYPIRVGESVESALSALAAIFSALSACFNNFCQKLLKYALRAEKMASSALRADSTLSPTLSQQHCQRLNGPEG